MFRIFKKLLKIKLITWNPKAKPCSIDVRLVACVMIELNVILKSRNLNMIVKHLSYHNLEDH